MHGCRSYGRISAAPARRENRDYSLVCSIVRIAGTSCISVRQTAFRPSKTTMFAPITRATQELVLRIFKRIYEDDINGAISHERFLKLSADYEAEQKELTEQVKAWRQAVETFEQDQADFASFAAIVRKYVGIRELTPTIVNEFVKKIIVHAPDKSSGHRRQKIELVWNFIGEVNLPGDDQTVERQRKGRTA